MASCETTCDESARRCPHQFRPNHLNQTFNMQLASIGSAHRNDLENNLLIILIAFMYLLTDPQPTVAINLLRIIVAFRCWHSLVYGVYPIRQPARSIGFLVPWPLMAYMGVMVLWRFVDGM